MGKTEEIRNKNKLPANKFSGKNNRKKGHDLERYVVRRFKDIGYKHCKTSRNASKLLDDVGVDIAYGPPMSIQTKRGYSRRRPKYELLYQTYKQKIEEEYPPDDIIHELPYVVIHQLDGKKPEHFQVTQDFESWMDLVTDYTDYNMLKIELKEWINSLDSTEELPVFLEKLFKE